MTESWPRDIEQHGIRYQLLAPLTPTRARLRFDGPFEGGTTLWDATLLALGANPADRRRAYLSIGTTGTAGTPIEIGVQVETVDEAVILRTIIMVRQYKRLRRGHMQFGESP